MGVELWTDEESQSIWERSGSVFIPKKHRDRPLAAGWMLAELALALRGRQSSDARDCPTGGTTYFPAGFAYSPNTGKGLEPCPTFRPDPWLPPCGQSQVSASRLSGLKLTERPLALAPRSDWSAAPDALLPRPTGGGQHFMVCSCGLNGSFLFALDPSHGCIHCWQPSAKTWATLKPEGLVMGRSSIQNIWRPECVDINANAPLLCPTDQGVLAVVLNPLTLTYAATLLCEGTCASPLLLHGDQVFGLINQGKDEHLSLVGMSPEGEEVQTVLENIPNSDWRVAISTMHSAIWLSAEGQVCLSDADSFFQVWPITVKPEFRFGPPYCGENDGTIWQQVLRLRENGEENGYAYMRLEVRSPEIRPASSARLHTGKSCMKVEQWIKQGQPWLEPAEEQIAPHQNDEIVIPLLQSTGKDDLLVVRSDHTGSPTDYMRRDEPLIARYQIFRQQPDHSGFFIKKVHRPWETTAFIYDGKLFLHHLEFAEIPGWSLEAKQA